MDHVQATFLTMEGRPFSNEEQRRLCLRLGGEVQRPTFARFIVGVGSHVSKVPQPDEIHHHWIAVKQRTVKSPKLKRNPKLSTEKQEPDKGHSDHRDTYADDKQQ
jgi:hypothetical protein